MLFAILNNILLKHKCIVNCFIFLASEEDVLRHNPEIAQLLSVALKYIPFLLILLSKAVFDHIPGE